MKMRLFFFFFALLGKLVSAVPSGFIDEEIARVKDGTGSAFITNQITGTPMLVVANKEGLLYGIENSDAVRPSAPKVILNMTSITCSNGERGLQSIVAHPNFQDNQWLYLFYSSRPQGETECLIEDTIRGPRNLVSRMKVGSDNMIDTNTEEVLLTSIPLYDYNHNGGGMRFGVDGHLYVATGDGGDRADLYSQKKNMLLGKVLRITADGGIPEDNPYLGTNSARCHLGIALGQGMICQEIHSIGLRNPFRFAMDMNSKEEVRFLIGDVGGNIWEEINEGAIGKNYGWPIREGPCKLASSDDCESTSYDDPSHWYLHTNEGGCALGGTFIPDEAGWPAEFKGGYLQTDFVFGTISLLTKTAEPCRYCSPPVSEWANVTFHEWPRPADLLFGPFQDGMALYYTARQGARNIRRIRYLGGDNTSPVAAITSSATLGEAPVTVDFDASGSMDPDGDALTYAWDFGDVSPDSTASAVAVTFDTPGVYTIVLTVTDSSSFSNTASVEIQVGTLPTVFMDSPPEGATFAVGDIFMAEGRALDKDGNALPASSMAWEVRQHHNMHYHPYLGITSGNKFFLPGGPEPEDVEAATNSYLEVLLSVSDADGLTTVISRNVMPKSVAVFLDSIPSGMEVWVDDYPVTTPASIVAWEKQLLTLEARDQSGAPFLEWSHGGAARHEVQISDSSLVWAYTAQFDDGSTGPPTTPSPAATATPLSPVTASPIVPASPVDTDGPTSWWTLEESTIKPTPSPVTVILTASPVTAEPTTEDSGEDDSPASCLESSTFLMVLLSFMLCQLW